MRRTERERERDCISDSNQQDKYTAIQRYSLSRDAKNSNQTVADVEWNKNIKINLKVLSR